MEWSLCASASSAATSGRRLSERRELACLSRADSVFRLAAEGVQLPTRLPVDDFVKGQFVGVGI